MTCGIFKHKTNRQRPGQATAKSETAGRFSIQEIPRDHRCIILPGIMQPEHFVGCIHIYQNHTKESQRMTVRSESVLADTSVTSRFRACSLRAAVAQLALAAPSVLLVRRPVNHHS